MNWRTAWRLLREFSGDRAYEQYLEHHAATHPDRPALTEKQFWRRRTDAHAPRTCC